jgi:hypothetical protein
MAEAFRPFCKTFTISSNGTQTVTLLDSAGNNLKCNYIQVKVMAGVTNNGLIVVEPSGISSNPRVSPGNGTSGTLGAIGTVLDPIELTLAKGQMCSSISVSANSNLGSNIPISVIYGVKSPINTMSSYGRSIGG